MISEARPRWEEVRSLGLSPRGPTSLQPELRDLAPVQPASRPAPPLRPHPDPAPPPQPRCRLTWLTLRVRVGLLRCAGLGAPLVLGRPGAASSSLRLRLLVSRRVWLARGLRAARVAAAPLRAVPQDVLDEEGGERLGLGGRPRLPGPRRRSPEHPLGSAAGRRRQLRPRRLHHFHFPPPGALISLGSAPRRPPIGRGNRARRRLAARAPGEGGGKGSPLARSPSPLL